MAFFRRCNVALSSSLVAGLFGKKYGSQLTSDKKETQSNNVVEKKPPVPGLVVPKLKAMQNDCGCAGACNCPPRAGSTSGSCGPRQQENPYLFEYFGMALTETGVETPIDPRARYDLSDDLVVSYNNDRNLPVCVLELLSYDVHAYNNLPGTLQPPLIYKGLNAVDPRVYNNGGPYHPGQLASPDHHKHNMFDYFRTFSTLNTAPMHGEVRRGAWAVLNDFVFQLIRGGGRVIVLSGPAFNRSDLPLAKISNENGCIEVPPYFYKIILQEVYSEETLCRQWKQYSFLIPNIPEEDMKPTNRCRMMLLGRYLANIDLIESMTGLSFRNNYGPKPGKIAINYNDPSQQNLLTYEMSSNGKE